MINYVPGQSWEELKQDPNIEVYTGPSGIYYFAIFNTNVPPFDDPMVRKALQWIPDREAMCEIVYSGLCWAIHGDPQPPNSGMYTGIETFQSPDLEKAREYLAQSDYPDGFEAEMGFYGGAQDEGQMAEIFQANAAELGITFNVRAVDEAVWREKVWAGDFESLVTGRGGYDPDGFFYELVHPEGGSKWNTPGYNNEEVNALLEEAQTILDPDERKELYTEALELLYEDGWPLTYLVATQERTASLADVEGYRSDGQGLARWLKYTWLDR
jgi:peptide/nickel transport system substrate-binding protein